MLLYGHLDKQPEMIGWAEGYGPWTPRIEGDKLYGRGGADDGYAIFGALTALLALHDAEAPHARCVDRDRGLRGIGQLRPAATTSTIWPTRIGKPSLVVCLDSGCGNYDQLWLTTSLRGIAGGTLTVEVLTEGVHSGDASGVVPSSFRILRELLSRLEDESDRRDPAARALRPDPAAAHRAGARRGGGARRDGVHRISRSRRASRPMGDDLTELVLNRTWRPQLAITGIDGLPMPGNAGNVGGIAPEAMASLFQRGFSTKQEKKGGIGLHWCANSVIAMNGKIHATSDGAGQGATFHLLLPAAPQRAEGRTQAA